MIVTGTDGELLFCEGLEGGAPEPWGSDWEHPASAEKHRLNTYKNEFWFKNHIKIDNTNLKPDEVADIIIEKFALVACDKEEREYRFGI